MYHAVTVTGPADAEPPPPVSVILDVVAVAKVYLSSSTFVIKYPAAKFIVAAATPPTLSAFLNLTLSFVDLPWSGSLTDIVVDPLVVVKAFNGNIFGTAVSILSGLTFSKI